MMVTSRTVVSVREPKKMTQDGTLIDMIVKFAELPMEVRFTASAVDGAPHGRDLHARALAGEFGPVAEAPPNAPPTWPLPKPPMPKMNPRPRPPGG